MLSSSFGRNEALPRLDFFKQREVSLPEMGIRDNQALIQELHHRGPAGMGNHALLQRGRGGRQHPGAIRE